MIRDDPACTDPSAQRRCAAMRVEHLDAVMAIERTAYTVPWTRGNFIDSMASGCTALCLLDSGHDLLGYALSMSGAGEVHLLNLTIASPFQGRGHARHLLGELRAAWRDAGAEQAWLEVRAGNLSAQRLYRHFGFVEVGRRRGYYPQPAGAAGASREDAITMRLPLCEAAP